MTVLGSLLDPRSAGFQANAARMAERLAEGRVAKSIVPVRDIAGSQGGGRIGQQA